MAMGTHTPGPIHLFCRFRGAATVYYVGTCVAAPEPEHHKSRIPVMNDLAGRNEPFQIVKDGENAVVFATMNRFDWPLLQSIRALDSQNTPPATPGAGNLLAGQENAGVRGTLVVGYTDFQLLLWSQYNGFAGQSGTANDALPIRQYNSVELADYKESTTGTRVLEVACAFKCVSVYSVPTLSFGGGTVNTTGGLYTENASQIGVTPSELLALVALAGA